MLALRRSWQAITPLWCTTHYCTDVPAKVQVFQQFLTTSFARSSGPGGQNVNKLNTKAEARFIVREANWIPKAVFAPLGATAAQCIHLT